MQNLNKKFDGVIKKYIKRLLTRLEARGIVTSVVRKDILDELNSMAREIAVMQESGE